MNPAYDLQGQVALVTGASSGMGLAAARAFAHADAAVALTDVNEPALQAATDGLAGAGHHAMSLTCDVSDEDRVAATVEQTIAQFGRLDMAFNNAGIMVPPASAAEEPADQRGDRQQLLARQPGQATGAHRLSRSQATASSDSPRAQRSNTHPTASVSTRSAPARSTRRSSRT